MTPLLAHWSYCSLALSHRYMHLLTVQTITWCLVGSKPSFVPVLTGYWEGLHKRWFNEIAATSPRGQWVNSLRPSDACMRQQTNQHWFRQWLGVWSAPSHYLNPCWDIVNWTHRNKLKWYFIHFHSRKCIWKCSLENGGHFISPSMC